jgi:hypothetical protein
LWEQPVIDHEDVDHRIDRAGILPRPRRPILGRDVDAFGFESIQQYNRGDNQWPRDIAAWREAGGSHISVVTMGANLTTVDGHIDAIRRWRDIYNSVR